MKLTLTPQQGLPGHDETAIAVAGDTVTVDGTPYDLTPVPEGGVAIAPDGTPFVGPITRQGGVIHATLRVVLDDTTESDQPDDPAHWVIEQASGLVEIPAIRKEMTQ